MPIMQVGGTAPSTGRNQKAMFIYDEGAYFPSFYLSSKKDGMPADSRKVYVLDKLVTYVLVHAFKTGKNNWNNYFFCMAEDWKDSGGCYGCRAREANDKLAMSFAKVIPVITVRDATGYVKPDGSVVGKNERKIVALTKEVKGMLDDYLLSHKSLRGLAIQATRYGKAILGTWVQTGKLKVEALKKLGSEGKPLEYIDWFKELTKSEMKELVKAISRGAANSLPVNLDDEEEVETFEEEEVETTEEVEEEAEEEVEDAVQEAGEEETPDGDEEEEEAPEEDDGEEEEDDDDIPF